MEKDADATKNPANPKARFGDMKRRVDLVPPALTLGAAVAFGEGAGKYGPFNWRTNHVEAMTYVGAMLRHMFAYMDGEDVDPESTKGKLHLEGIAACIGILLDSTYQGILIDNRPNKGPAPGLTRLPATPVAQPKEVPAADPNQLHLDLSSYPKRKEPAEDLLCCDDPNCPDCPLVKRFFEVKS